MKITLSSKSVSVALATSLAISSVAFFAAQAKATTYAHKYSIALIGDMPYDAKGVTQTPAVIADINNNPLVNLSLFDGDTMSGKGDKCIDSAYANIKKIFFDEFTKPIFYSVGDNEWVDCDRAVKGAFDPLTRLALVRSTYFRSTDGTYISLGKNQLNNIKILHDANYPEMQIFTLKGITYILPHVPGSANNSAVAQPAFKTYNDTAKDGDDAEYKARDAANVAWINKGFEVAKAEGSIGVIVTVQADMDWEGFARELRPDSAGVPQNENVAAFANVKQALLTNTLAFKKPVLLQNGDQHWFQVDMPLNETAGKIVEKDKGSMVENFTRVQTFGSGFNHWVELIIDPKDPNLWSFKVHLIKSNFDKH